MSLETAVFRKRAVLGLIVVKVCTLLRRFSFLPEIGRRF